MAKSSGKCRSERALQKRLCSNIACLEPGLEIICTEKVVSYGTSKREANPGRIDIVAQDSAGTTVIIELKKEKAGRRAVGQILGYMGTMMDGKNRVRGILVAKRFSPQGKAAARVVPTLKLITLSNILPRLFL